MTTQTLLVNKLFKRIWITLAILIILAALTSSIFRSLTPWAKQYKGEVEMRLSLILGHPVTIKSMETGWYWFQPVLKLNQVDILDNGKEAVHLDKMLVGINIIKSLWYWNIQPGVLVIDDIHLNFVEKDNQWTIKGISSNALGQDELTPTRTLHILGWIAEQERLILRHISAHFHFANGTLIPISGLNISIVNESGYYKLKGEARLLQTNSTSFQLLGDVYFDPYHLDKTQGSFFFSAKNVLPAQWQMLIPNASQRLEGGKGDIDLWLDIQKGKISSVQSQIKFKRLAWHMLDNLNSQLIQSFFANLSWQPNDTGWQFKADHIKLRVGDFKWPENKMLVNYVRSADSYQVYIQSILLESLRSEAIPWPADLNSMIALKPEGILSETQFIVKDSKLNYVLSRFNHLGWQSQGHIPQVMNLSGVLNWQPEQGRLELDSNQVALKFQGYPEQDLAILNGAVVWKMRDDGLQINMDRLVLEQKELTFSAQGEINQVTNHSVGQVQLAAEFSGKHLEKWVKYIPKAYLKPGFNQWLKHAFKRIEQATGKMIIKGNANEFPFDNQQGEFEITAHGSGVDMVFAPKWPLSKDVEAYLRLKRRNLEIDIINGYFREVPVQKMHLRVDDIGHDKEKLLLHTLVNAEAQKLVDFILNSPLKRRLAHLKLMTLQGLAELNLRLEIPLYPPHDNVSVKGDLHLKDNQLISSHQFGEVKIDNLTGQLSFNQQEIVQSALSGTAFGYPINIAIQSVKKPHPATQVLIDGECTIESLKSRLNLPIVSLLKGIFPFQILIDVPTSAHAMEKMNLKTDLSGLAINLPSPLGKSAKESVSSQVELDVVGDNEFRIQAHYGERLSTDLTFKKVKEAFSLYSGDLHLGDEKAKDSHKPGLGISGFIKGYDYNIWKKVYTQLGAGKSTIDLTEKLREIDVTLDKINLLNQEFSHLQLNARMLPDQQWLIKLKRNPLSAELTFDPNLNALSGHINHLHLANMPSNSEKTKTKLKPKPSDIPRLNLQVDDLEVANKYIGNLTLRSTSEPNRWHIEYCSIDAPEYQLKVQGDWTMTGDVHQTKMEVKLHINNLAKTLQHWKISPVMDAGMGDMSFKGGWDDSLYDFSLNTLNGNLYLQLKNGIITHLSSETESKLGLGKLLSILSLQTIPRRLKLDFSDLSHEGYSFDVFKGNFKITKGIMTTDDSYLDGPVAYASMKGDLDLAKRNYNLDLHISPHITASLPVVATIAGGPLAGAAAWVVNKIINKSMQKISGYSYRVTGPWGDPVVQQIKIVKKN